MSDPAATVRRRLAGLIERRGAAGAQYVVLRDGRLLLECCLGLADVASGRPVTPETTFNAYSIAKVFTAATVMALAQAGRIDLDAPIGAAAGVDGLEAYGTVRETLLHRAGFRNPNPLRWIHPAAEHHAFDEAAFVRTRLAALHGSHRRHARSGYSNLGYLALGRAVERAMGQSFVPGVQALLIDPLRLQASQRLGFAIDRPEHHAHGHVRRHGLLDLALGWFVDRASIVEHADPRWVKLRLHQVDGSAFGGLIANAQGLARFGHAVLAADGPFTPALRRPVLEEVPGAGPPRSLAWFGGRVGRDRWFAHAGGGLGAYGELRVYPDRNAVSALLTNGPGLRDARCLDGIDAEWLDR